MPIINITLIEGRENKAIEKCIKEVANTVHKELDAPYSTITVYVNEVSANRLSEGNKLISEI